MGLKIQTLKAYHDNIFSNTNSSLFPSTTLPWALPSQPVSPHARDPLFHPELDDNNTLSPVQPLTNPAIVSVGVALSNLGPGNLQYSYNLNTVNQAKKLIKNADRPNFNIKYSNFQMINGSKHATSVSIDCNSGVYLSVFKPALEAISVGWQSEIMNTVITCVDTSQNCLDVRSVPN